MNIQTTSKRAGDRRTDQGMRIAQLIADGHNMKTIGGMIGLADRTAEDYLTRLRLMHGARTTSHLIAILFRKNLLK